MGERWGQHAAILGLHAMLKPVGGLGGIAAILELHHVSRWTGPVGRISDVFITSLTGREGSVEAV